MIVFRNNLNPLRHGFTLPEVLLAVAIIGLTLTPIYLGQSNAMRQSSDYSKLLTRTLAAKKILLEAEFTLPDPLQSTKITKKIDNPLTTFSYEIKKIPEQSSLKKFKNVWIESVSWPDERNPKRQNRIVTFLYKPEQKKNE